MRKYKDLAVEDRPINKMEDIGVGKLNNIEIISILLDKTFGSKRLNDDLFTISRRVYTILENYSFDIAKVDSIRKSLLTIDGIKDKTANKIIAILELANRISSIKSGDIDYTDLYNKPEHVYKMFYSEAQDLKESTYLVFLDNRESSIKKELLSVGSMDTSIISIREIIKKCIANNARTYILVHNHPSGNTSPSDADIKMTKRLIEVGELMQIELTDHIIIAKDTRHNKDIQKWFSMKEEFYEWWG